MGTHTLDAIYPLTGSGLTKTGLTAALLQLLFIWWTLLQVSMTWKMPFTSINGRKAELIFPQHPTGSPPPSTSSTSSPFYLHLFFSSHHAFLHCRVYRHI